MKNLQGFLTFVSPSTYIGPVFNNNGKSYAENVMSGEGTGDVAGNVAIDILTPFAIGGINKGVQIGNRFYGMRQLSKAIDNSSPTLQQIPLNIGWGPKQTIPVSHASNTGDMQLFFPKRWDVINEGANPHGIWFQGKLGVPRTDLTNPGKGAKAAKARALFANRPVQVQGNVTLEKPMITIGDVPNRSWLSYYADDAGADGLIYNGIYDNGYNNNQVILSFRKIDKPNYISKLSNSSTPSSNSNVNSDALNLHFERLKNGGYDKLKKQLQDYMANNPLSSGSLHFNDNGRIGEMPFVRKNLRDQVSMETPQNPNSIFTEQDLQDAGGAIAFTSQGMIEYSPEALLKNGYDINRSLSHELDHALHIPIEKPQGFNLSNLSDTDRLYFTKFRGTELSARGSQIKDWLKFNRSNQNITESDLKNAAQNYINDTGMNNKMTQFFNSIFDYKKAAEWLSKYSTGLSIPIILNKNE